MVLKKEISIKFYPHECYGGSLKAVTIINTHEEVEADDQSEADTADITDISEDFETAQAISDNETSDTTSDYDCYHPSRCVSEAGTPGRFVEYRGTPERDFTLTSNLAPINALTSPNNRILGNRGQPSSPPARTRSLREALDEMNTTSEVRAVAETIDQRRERIRREVHDFFETFNNNARFEIEPPPPARVPYALHAYLWEGSETLEDQLRRQLPTDQPDATDQPDVLSITQELEAMDTSGTEDQPDLEYHPTAIVHDEDLAHIDARAALATPTLGAVLRDLEVLEDDDDETMSHISYDSNESFDWRVAYSDQFSSDDEAEEAALPGPIEDPPTCSTPKRNNPDVEDEENS